MCWRGRVLVAAAAVVSLAAGLDGRNVRNVPSTSYVEFKMPEAAEEGQTTATPEVTTCDRDKEAEGTTTGGAAEEIVDRDGVPGSSYIVDRNKEANQTDGGGTSSTTVAVPVTATPVVVTQKTPGGVSDQVTTETPAVTPQKTPGGVLDPATTAPPVVHPQNTTRGALAPATATPLVVTSQKTPDGVLDPVTVAPPVVAPQKIPGGPPAPVTAAPPAVTPQKTPGEAVAQATPAPPRVNPEKPPSGDENVEVDKIGVPGTSYVSGDKEKKPNAESMADIVFPAVYDHNNRAGMRGGESTAVTNAPKDGSPSKDKLCVSASESSELSIEAKHHCGLIDLPSKIKHSSLSPKKKLMEKGSGKTKQEDRKGDTSGVKTKSKEHEANIGDYKMKSNKDEMGDAKTKSKEHNDDIGDYKMKSEETQDDASVKATPEGQKDNKHIKSKSKRSVADVKKRKTKKSNTELLNHLGLVKLKSPAVNHHRKRLASQSRKTHLSQVGGDSKMFVIKLPPEPYYFSRHDELEAKSKPSAALPVSFSSNGKPSRVYHWNIPLLKKMVARKAVSPKAAVFASDAFSVDKQATWNEAGDEKSFHRKTSFYAPKKASKEAFRKYFSSNGKPHSFYVMDKSDKPKSTYKLIP